MQQNRIILGIGVLILLTMAGISGASGAAYCNISNTTIAAMCANLTSSQTAINSINITLASNSNAIASNSNSLISLSNTVAISSNKITANTNNIIALTYNAQIQGNYISNLASNQSNLWSNVISIQSSIDANSSSVNDILSTVNNINDTVISTEAIALSADANATDAKSEADYAVSHLNSSQSSIDAVNNSVNQKTGILNNNITTIKNDLTPLVSAGVGSTYASFVNEASGSDLKSDIALGLVVILIIVEVIKIFTGRKNKPKQEPLNPQLQGEANAKANVIAGASSNNEQLKVMQKQKEDLETRAKLDKLEADPDYKSLKAAFDKDIAKAKKYKLKMDITGLDSYKALNEKALKYGVNIEGAPVKGG